MISVSSNYIVLLRGESEGGTELICIVFQAVMQSYSEQKRYGGFTP